MGSQVGCKNSLQLCPFISAIHSVLSKRLLQAIPREDRTSLPLLRAARGLMVSGAVTHIGDADSPGCSGCPGSWHTPFLGEPPLQQPMDCRWALQDARIALPPVPAGTEVPCWLLEPRCQHPRLCHWLECSAHLLWGKQALTLFSGLRGPEVQSGGLMASPKVLGTSHLLPLATWWEVLGLGIVGA